MKKLETKSCEEIMSTAYKPLEYCVDGLLTQGLYILAGAPKVGKSWLALDICLSVAKGEDVLKHQTHIGTALYLCLEDSYNRIQNRLYELTDEPTENLYFAIMSESLGNGLETQIETFKSHHPDTKLIVIDTLQMVRNEKDCGYGADYKELSILKALADKLAITILLVHHTRKCYDSDPFNMISGSTGISGCVDGSMVLLESKRGSREAKLYCVGRDIENQEYRVLFHEHRWTPCDEIAPTAPDIFSFAIHDFMMEQQSFIGSATTLCDLLYQKFNRKYFPNRLSRDLIQHTEELQRYGVLFNFRRSHGCRILELEYIASGDSSDGRILWVEILDSTGTQNYENVDSALFQCCDDSETGAGNSQTGDGRTASGDGNFIESWIGQLYQNEDFVKRVAKLYFERFEPFLQLLTESEKPYLTQMAESIQTSAEMSNARWHTYGGASYCVFGSSNGATFMDSVDIVRKYINQRKNWLGDLWKPYTYVKGDVNGDGVLDIADIVLLQKWLLAVPDTHLSQWQAADLCKDKRLDVFDLCLLKRELLYK